MKNKSKLNIFLTVNIVFLIVFSVVFSAFFIKSNMGFILEKSNAPAITIGNNDASEETNIPQRCLYREFNDRGFSLLLDENKNYILSSKQSQYQFSGKYTFINGEKILEEFDAQDLMRKGLNPKRINLNNLYLIKANYDTHYFANGNEYYDANVHNPDDNCFCFLIYFKQELNGEFLTAISPVSEISQPNFNLSYF